MSCWTVGEMLKGKKCVLPDQQKQLSSRLDTYDWSQGAGPKLKQLLMRGIGVHHAGVLPRYRRIVEDLPVAEAPVTAITSLYMRARYGPASQDDADSNEADVSWGRARYRILRRWLGRMLLPWRRR